MIISEKQIIQLMDIAQWHINLVRAYTDDEETISSKKAIKLLREIQNQQSEEIKVIE